jgi:leucine dehydrogenase
LAPCAIGGIINESTIGRIKAPIIAGAANNQLDDEEEDGQRVVEAGITYAPDYVINAGGLINVYAELKNLPASQAMAQSTSIFDTVKRVINLAREAEITSTEASNRIAEERIELVSRLQRLRSPTP